MSEENIWDSCCDEAEKIIKEEEAYREKLRNMPKPEINTEDPVFNRWLSNRINRVESTIQRSSEGNLHDNRIKASNLLGGLVPHYMTEADAEGMLLNFIADKTKKPRLAEKDIRDGIRHGMKRPLYFYPEGNPFKEGVGGGSSSEGDHSVILKGDWIYVPEIDSEPPNPEPLVRFCNAKVLSRGNITMLGAHAGQGKTNICAAISVASLDSFEADTLGFSVPPALKVYYVDTEMNKRDHWVTWDRARRRVGYNNDNLPPNIQWRSIRGGSLEQRKEYLWTLIEFEKPDLLIMDGVGDFVSDVNNADECTDLSNNLCRLVHNHNIGIFLTLHLNPGLNNKVRGHLGSELWRKCECNMTIKKGEDEDGAYAITTDFNMGKNRSDKSDLTKYYKWDDELNMHVSYNKHHEPRERTDCIAIAEKMFDGHGYQYSELVNMFMGLKAVSVATAKRRVSDGVVLGIFQKEGNVYYKNSIR